jgi:hypothetical protein
MATYTVRAMTFKCLDESGADFTGSDEPYWVFTALDSQGAALATNRSREFGQIDSGDTKRFKSGGPGAGQNIVWPDKGQGQGAQGPIALSIQLWDADQGDPEQTRKFTEAAFAALGVIPPTVWVNTIPNIVRTQLIQTIADDIMGSRTLLFPTRRLDNELTRPGDFFEQTFRFSGSSGDLPFDIAGGPDYELTLQVERTS